MRTEKLGNCYFDFFRIPGASDLRLSHRKLSGHWSFQLAFALITLLNMKFLFL